MFVTHKEYCAKLLSRIYNWLLLHEEGEEFLVLLAETDI